MKRNERNIIIVLAISLLIAGLVSTSIVINRTNTQAVQTQRARSQQIQLYLDQTRAADRNP